MDITFTKSSCPQNHSLLKMHPFSPLLLCLPSPIAPLPCPHLLAPHLPDAVWSIFAYFNVYFNVYFILVLHNLKIRFQEYNTIYTYCGMYISWNYYYNDIYPGACVSEDFSMGPCLKYKYNCCHMTKSWLPMWNSLKLSCVHISFDCRGIR